MTQLLLATIEILLHSSNASKIIEIPFILKVGGEGK